MTSHGKAIIGLGAALLVAAAGCGGEKGRKEAGAPEREPVLEGLKVAVVATEPVPVRRELAGAVQAAAVSQVSPRIMAQVLSVEVKEGDRVAKDQLLVMLDDRELQAKVRQAEAGARQAEAALLRAEAALPQAEGAVRQAEAQLELATATHARFRALLEGRAVSRQEYEQVAAQETVAREGLAQARSGVAQAKGGVEQARSAVAQAASAVEEARTWLGFARIRAPYAGRVTAKRTDPGSMAVPGMPLLSIEGEGAWRVEVPVDVSLSGAVVPGTAIAVEIEAADLSRTVPVTEVVPTVDPVSRTFLAKADLPADPALRSGQYARVSVATGAQEAVAVRETALVRRGQLDGVYVVDDDGRLAYRILQLGRAASPGTREVLAGLAAGERIVVEGAERARDGARIAAAPAEAVR